jgi:protein-L-isoaspartate(D-aspartate) O-methyltransferase
VIDWQPRAATYAEQLAAEGAITDPAWQQAFATTPRHLFVPRYWALDQYNSPSALIDGTDPEQRETWLDAVYSDRLLITQWAQSRGSDGRSIRVVTSSASQPCTVAVMLDRLAVEDPHHVLEIGTGTGYNAALLATRLGADNVSSVDIDPELIDQADTSLHAGGYRPRLHTGDGAAGLADAAPFDRIIATCAVDRIPPAWVDQLTPGGRLVVPLTFAGALAVLDKTGDNEVSGRIDPYAVYFMPLRGSADQAKPASIAPDLPDAEPVGARHDGLTDVDPRALDDPDFLLWLSLHLPGVHLAPAYEDGQQTEIIVYTARQRATCACQPVGDGLWPVTQHGQRPWDTVETAWRTWDRNGRPPRDRLGVTARGDGRQHMWLDEPTSQHTWPMPTIEHPRR